MKCWPLWVVLILIAVVTGIKAFLNPMIDDFKGDGETWSRNVEEAERRGVLVTELDPVPKEIPVPGGPIRFGEIWVEERALSTHQYVWIPHEQRVGGYRIHITLTEGQERMKATGLVFMLDGDWRSFRESPGLSIYVADLTDPDVPGMRLGLGHRAGGPFLHEIRLVPKPAQ